MDHASGRDAIAPGQFGNLLELHRDTPNEWDAWDIDAFYRRNVAALTGVRSAGGGIPWPGRRRCGGAAGRNLGGHPADHRWTGSRSLAITTAVDWQESEKLLKLGFALDVRADRSASETQFGHVFRPTHLNTSWEAAKFEICAHRWIHVAEPGYGVAVSNSSTYGHDVTRNIREARRRHHHHCAPLAAARAQVPGPRGGPRPARTDRHHPARRQHRRRRRRRATARTWRRGWSRAPHGVEPLVAVSNPALVVEAVKLAEDGSGDVIVRVYESLGERSAGRRDGRFRRQRRRPWTCWSGRRRRRV